MPSYQWEHEVKMQTGICKANRVKSKHPLSEPEIGLKIGTIKISTDSDLNLEKNHTHSQMGCKLSYDSVKTGTY